MAEQGGDKSFVAVDGAVDGEQPLHSHSNAVDDMPNQNKPEKQPEIAVKKSKLDRVLMRYDF